MPKKDGERRQAPTSTSSEHDHIADKSEIAALRAENARLIALLESHGITWQPQRSPAQPQHEKTVSSAFSTVEKVALFQGLFQGRSDVYAVRWQSRSTGHAGYAPACANEWRPGICEKPRIKCSECGHRLLLPLTDAALYKHLTGEHTIGLYPMLADGTCHFLAVDFDDADWRADVRAFKQSCDALDVPVALEVSRSGEGAHAWIFFADRVPARDARRLGTALISQTCARIRQLQLQSYDRMFPNQDTLPKGGFGNLIALPLQREPRRYGRSVFVDSVLHAYPDQWAFLASIRRMAVHDIEPVILQATGGGHPLDIAFMEEDELATPWKRKGVDQKLSVSCPKTLRATLVNQLYFEKALLPQPLANRLIRLAAFQNPEFYRAQAMRLPVWNKPRVIGCAENYPHHIALPRGCLDAALTLLQDNGIACDLHDERFGGADLDVAFTGTLRPDQEAAAAAMLSHDTGVLCAPTAFGKTVVATAMIARRHVNTLVLVHRVELLRQWQERLHAFLTAGRDVIGTVGGGKRRPSGLIDVALMQSLSRQGEADTLIEAYGQIIVDECHHIGAVSFEALLKRAKAKYVLGLTATPIRRDGQHPIIFMQCGPMRHIADRPAAALQTLRIFPRLRTASLALPDDVAIQTVFSRLCEDKDRTREIAAAIKEAFLEGRKILVLTERAAHLAVIRAAIDNLRLPIFVLHGRIPRKQRALVLDKLKALPPDAPRIVLATGKLVGEGFDHPPLDTLVLAMPVSWHGTLQQYAGRLHRAHVGKTESRIIDFVDTGHVALERMWAKRLRGYRAMGYQVQVDLPAPSASANRSLWQTG